MYEYNEEETPVLLQLGGNPYSRGEETLPLLQGGGVPCPLLQGGGDPLPLLQGGRRPLPLLQGEGGPCTYSRGKEAATAPTPGGGGTLPPLHPCPHSTPAPTPGGEEAHCPYSNPISWAVKQSWQPLLWKIASCPRDFAHIFLYNKTYLCNIAGGS